MNSLAQRLCSFRAHHVSLYPLNVCKKDARADQQCLLGFVLLQLKNQQLEDLDFMFVLRKERCLRLSTTACEERTGGKGVVGAPGRQQARSRKRGSHLTPPTICDVFFGG